MTIVLLIIIILLLLERSSGGGITINENPRGIRPKFNPSPQIPKGPKK